MTAKTTSRPANRTPPGPFRPTFWRSPLRGPWLTSALGSILLVLLAIVIVTGFLSHVAYEPNLRGNAIVPAGADLPLLFSWPTAPTYLYAVTQGLHVNVGLAAVPLLLAKLWSVIPRLFAFPPVSSPAQALERLSIALLVSSAVFQFVTGIMNAQYWYAFKFNFVVAHYYGAVVFTAALALHVVIKTPVILRAYRRNGWVRPLRDDLRSTRQEPGDEHGGLVAVDPAAPTISRRGLFAFAGGASLLLVAANVGQTIGGPLRSLAFLAPRREDFPVNRTAARAQITAAMVGPAYQLTLTGGGTEVLLDRGELLALPQHTARLPIACVEGWTTTQEWTGVRLVELVRTAGLDPGDVLDALVRSLQPRGVLSKASLNGAQVRDPDSMLALRVNGADLPLDHGYPARIIVPALPGVHNTKWVGSIDFRT